MLDIRWMRENREVLAEAMQKLHDFDAPWEKALALDEERRELLTKVEALRAAYRELQGKYDALSAAQDREVIAMRAGQRAALDAVLEYHHHGKPAALRSRKFLDDLWRSN